LSDNEHLLDFPQVVGRIAIDVASNAKEVGRISLLLEERSSEEVVVDARNGLTWLDNAKLQER
jgi:hypothetical protein